jgi:hypothetical protein
MGIRIGVALLATVATLVSLDLVFGNAGAPPAAKTGAPGEQTCATQCHTGTVNSGTGNVSISFNGGSNTYVAGQSYPVTVTVTDPTMLRYGFQITALNPGGVGASVGTFTLTNTTNTSAQQGNVGGVRRYVGHKTAGSNNTWTFQWNAPTSPTGPVTFYASGNATNQNGSGSGDKVYTTSLTVDLAVSNDLPQDAPFQVWPNPAQNELSIKFQEETYKWRIFDSNGKVIRQNQSQGSISVVDIQDILPGVYFIQIQGESGSRTEKFVKF